MSGEMTEIYRCICAHLSRQEMLIYALLEKLTEVNLSHGMYNVKLCCNCIILDSLSFFPKRSVDVDILYSHVLGNTEIVIVYLCYPKEEYSACLVQVWNEKVMGLNKEKNGNKNWFKS